MNLYKPNKFRPYSDDDILITNGFLRFQHTNGLNYLNFEVRRFDEVFDLKNVKIMGEAYLGLRKMLKVQEYRSEINWLDYATLKEKGGYEEMILNMLKDNKAVVSDEIVTTEQSI